jgi:hypothetical protein
MSVRANFWYKIFLERIVVGQLVKRNPYIFRENEMDEI